VSAGQRFLAAINNIFIDISQMENYTIFPIFVGLSDQVAQLLTISNSDLQMQSHKLRSVRKINIVQYLASSLT
jgi:hypothetical protein